MKQILLIVLGLLGSFSSLGCNTITCEQLIQNIAREHGYQKPKKWPPSSLEELKAEKAEERRVFGPYKHEQCIDEDTNSQTTLQGYTQQLGLQL